MTDKHTPGPWTVSYAEGCRLIWSEGRRIALVYSHTIQPGAVGDANARLIAAAPELLKALEFERQISLGNDPEAYPQFVEMRNAAIEAAIKS